jgi:hypothetical protein
MQSDDVLARSTRGSWWARHPRPLAKVGVTLVIVSAAILWVIFTRRPEAAPADLGQLDRVVGTVEGVSEDVRPLYTTHRGRKVSVHQAARRGWRLSLRMPAGQTAELLLRSDDESVVSALGQGARVTAFVRDGEIFQLENAGGILVSLDELRDERSFEASAALLLVALALLVGLALCGVAARAWTRPTGRS